MKRYFILFALFLLSCNADYPKEFSEKALKDMVISQDGSKKIFSEILLKHKGKKVLIDIWASWCKDCIQDFPKVKKLQEKFPDVNYVFISVDRGKSSWKKAIIKYDLRGDHYNLPKGMNEGDFVDFVKLNWISRFMVIDEKGEIKLFKATKASDIDIINALQ
jgi:thiol-disulfide isomerase/thioredoxin